MATDKDGFSAPRPFILHNSRSAIRSRSRSPQQMNVADVPVSAKVRNLASLSRRALSRSGTSSARFLDLVSIVNLVCFCGFPFAGEVRGELGRPPERNYYLPALGCYGSGDLVEGRVGN